MKATIEFQDVKAMSRLLHAFLACHNKWSHDKDIIEFERERDDLTLKIDMTVGGITFGRKSQPWNERLGTENMGSGFMDMALVYFIYSEVEPEYDNKLLEMDWIWGDLEDRKNAKEDSSP